MFIYTLHARDKLKTTNSKRFKITKKRIERAVKNGFIVEIENDVITAVDRLDQSYSFCVVYRKLGKGVRIITFFPAKKDRYERKILQ